MKTKIISSSRVIAFRFLSVVRGRDASPSWNDTGPKKAIVDFVKRVTKQGSPAFVKTENALRPSTTTARCMLNKPNYPKVIKGKRNEAST